MRFTHEAQVMPSMGSVSSTGASSTAAGEEELAGRPILPASIRRGYSRAVSEGGPGPSGGLGGGSLHWLRRGQVVVALPAVDQRGADPAGDEDHDDPEADQAEVEVGDHVPDPARPAESLRQ